MDDKELQKQQRRDRRDRKKEAKRQKYRRRVAVYYARLGAVLLLLIPMLFLSIWATVMPSDDTTSSVSGKVIEVFHFGGGKYSRPRVYIKLDSGFQYSLSASVVSQYEGGLQGFRDKLEGQYAELRIDDRKLIYNKAVQVKVNGEELIGYDAFTDIYRETRTWWIVISVMLVLGIELYLLCTYTRPKRYRKKS